MALELLELLGGVSTVVDGLAAIIYSGLRLSGVSEVKAKKVSTRLAIILSILLLMGAVYGVTRYL